MSVSEIPDRRCAECDAVGPTRLGGLCYSCAAEYEGDEQLTIFEAIELSEPINPADELGRVIPSRSTDPDTSRAAERGVKVRAGTQRARLLEAFADQLTWWANAKGPGLTDEQAMIMAPGVSASSEYAKRCSELREGGFIEPTGETRLGAAGTPRIVSKITDKGIEWVRENR